MSDVSCTGEDEKLLGVNRLRGATGEESPREAGESEVGCKEVGRGTQ